jgi:hypothetical protein
MLWNLPAQARGCLEVESTPGRGSRFWFSLPLPAVTTVLPTQPQRRIKGYRGPPRRVLIVDDIAENRAVLIDLLAPLALFSPKPKMAALLW